MAAATTVLHAAVYPPGYPTKFSETLCGCFNNWPVCCEEFWCSYCHLGTLFEYLSTGGRGMDPLACCGSLMCDVCLTMGIARCLVSMSIRNKIFVFYNFDREEESNCATCCIACLCTSCSNCQIHRELHQRGNYPGGVCCYTPPAETPGPMACAPMGHKEEPRGIPPTYPKQQPQPHPPPQQQQGQPQVVVGGKQQPAPLQYSEHAV